LEGRSFRVSCLGFWRRPKENSTWGSHILHALLMSWLDTEMQDWAPGLQWECVCCHLPSCRGIAATCVPLRWPQRPELSFQTQAPSPNLLLLVWQGRPLEANRGFIQLCSQGVLTCIDNCLVRPQELLQNLSLPHHIL
jgi:hypothetical protein